MCFHEVSLIKADKGMRASSGIYRICAALSFRMTVVSAHRRRRFLSSRRVFLFRFFGSPPRGPRCLREADTSACRLLSRRRVPALGQQRAFSITPGERALCISLRRYILARLASGSLRNVRAQASSGRPRAASARGRHAAALRGRCARCRRLSLSTTAVAVHRSSEISSFEFTDLGP